MHFWRIYSTFSIYRPLYRAVPIRNMASSRENMLTETFISPFIYVALSLSSYKSSSLPSSLYPSLPFHSAFPPSSLSLSHRFSFSPSLPSLLPPLFLPSLHLCLFIYYVYHLSLSLSLPSPCSQVITSLPTTSHYNPFLAILPIPLPLLTDALFRLSFP